MTLYLRLAWRNIWRHRRRTLIVILAIGFCMALMILYDGLIAGFEQAIYGNAIQVLGGNIQVHANGYQAEMDQNPLLPLENDQAVVQAAKAQPNVVGAARRIKTGGMATSTEGAFSATILGIEPEQEQTVSIEAQHVVAGRYLTNADTDVIFVGKGLADAMNVTVGDRITLVGRATHDQMRQHTLTIAGIYDLKMPSIEKRTIYMSLSEAQYLYGLTGQTTEVAIALKNIGQEGAVISALKPQLPGYEVTSWETNFPEMVAAISAKSGVMDIFSVIILVIAGIGTLNLLLMAVFERTREIGLMGALGMKPFQISNLFLLEGAMLGVIGLVFGILLGVAGNLAFAQVGMDYSKFANLTEYTALISGRIYPTLGLEKLPSRTLTVLVISLLSSFYPAREAAQKEPAEALHYV